MQDSAWMDEQRLTVRTRHDADLEPLLGLLALTHRDRGYPADIAYVRKDFIASPGQLGAWVAVHGERVVGHVALLRPGGVSAPLWRAALGRDDAGIAVVSRLFSGLSGAGGALLAQAVDAAREAGLALALEVERDSPAREFYLRLGWEAIGEVEQHWRQPAVAVVPMVLTET
jgi:GNAT superfamily N-acetyltransferase